MEFWSTVEATYECSVLSGANICRIDANSKKKEVTELSKFKFN